MVRVCLVGSDLSIQFLQNIDLAEHIVEHYEGAGRQALVENLRVEIAGVDRHLYVCHQGPHLWVVVVVIGPATTLQQN